ncbi:uncharacterized protein LOC131657933 [Vicia villosa]|uniref:uncharacterized protein LOC131657933 n=1 Tax=Vicia villosa TaxID=3911 RepID=UPI00273CB96A|nr:uncharacterized protein LOC131657933 [Vicia villosa]
MVGIDQSENNDFKIDAQGVLRFANRICIPEDTEMKKMILEESHKRKLSIHPRATKMLTKSAHFIPISISFPVPKLKEIYISVIVKLHGVPFCIVSDRDLRFTSDFWKSLQEALGSKMRLSSAYHSLTKAIEVKNLESITEVPSLEGTSNETPEEKWTVVSSNKSDKAKKKILFTPGVDMSVQNVFMPLGIGVVPGEGSSGSLLETRVKKDNASKIRQKFGKDWSYLDNYSHHNNGRIWIIWKNQEVQIKLVCEEEQFIHVEVRGLDGSFQYFATIVYAMNQLNRRKVLWEQIDNLGNAINMPWIVMGDYNNVLSSKDRIGGNPVHISEYCDLDDMMQRQGLYEDPSRGCHYTWSNKHITGTIYSMIDRLIGNVQWFQVFQEAGVEVLHPNIFDHSPVRVKRQTEKVMELSQMEEGSLQQKAKVDWLQLGDGNNSFFHTVVREKNKQNNMVSLTSLTGVELSKKEDIAEEIIGFYKSLVGTAAHTLQGIDLPCLMRGNTLSRKGALSLIQPFSEQEVWDALSGIGNTKAPGMDGFNSFFFKESWQVVKYDVMAAMHEFYQTGRMHKGLNCSLITLIPKTNEAKTIKDWRPVSCCSTFYKILSKVLTRRLSRVIGTVVNENQSAFIPGRIIHDNIMITQELVRGYGRKNISPRCMIQMDIQKAYDTVKWTALQQIMSALGFPYKYVQWIMACVETVSYRFALNGEPSDLLKAKRGVLQSLKDNPGFRFHPKCKKLNIVNVCFADDIILFSKADMNSIRILMDKVKEFSQATGLHMSIPKSKIYFGGVDSSKQG